RFQPDRPDHRLPHRRRHHDHWRPGRRVPRDRRRRQSARGSRPAAHRGRLARRHVMTVLVGVKRSADSRTAIRLAAQEALYRDTILIAVMAYPAERGWSPAVKPGAASLTQADDRAVAEDLLREAVSDALGDAARQVEHRV